MSGENGVKLEDFEQGDEEGKICRDFMRNVCNRGKNCKFIHPQDIKIRTEPIFCHDFQQDKCFRSSCKFIHCTREEEDHYKTTGELPEGYLASDFGSYGALRKGVFGANGRGRVALSGASAAWEQEDIPICKDFLKGQCDRADRCKFRHTNVQIPLPRRRPAQYFEAGPEAKRSLGSLGYSALGEYDDYYTSDYASPPPPPPQQSAYATPSTATYGASEINWAGKNGYGYGYSQSTLESQAQSYAASSTPGMKALEDENFMLKRRIEELKKQVNDLTATNEYLLSQNAHFRLAGMGKDSASAAASVVQTLVSMSQAQPLGITPSLSVAGGSMTALPSVSLTPASISQSLPVVSLAQHTVSLNSGQPQNVYPMVTTQGLPPPN